MQSIKWPMQRRRGEIEGQKGRDTEAEACKPESAGIKWCAIAVLAVGGLYLCGWVAGLWPIRFEEFLLQAVAVSGIFWGICVIGRRAGMGRSVGGLFPALAAVLALRALVGEPFAIPSASMEPTLVAGDRVWVWKTSYAVNVPVLDLTLVGTGKPSRGDVVVFRSPMDPRTDWIKRVVGVQGDNIVLTAQTLTVNGIADPRHEGLPAGQQVDFRDRAGTFPNSDLCSMRKEVMTCVVPRGHLFVAGDNRNNSEDSRRWGFLPEAAVVGKATALWWSGSDASRVGWIR